MYNSGVNLNFYNSFHKNSSTSNRLLTKENFTYRLIIPVIHKVIQGHTNLRVLDYGCGVGTIGLYLASLGNSVTGIDISSKAVKIANQNKINLGFNETSTFLTLKKSLANSFSKYFDLVLCIEVIEHVKDDKKLINWLSKVCKSGATLILSTPSINAPLYKRGILKEFDLRVGHLRRYRSQSLVNLVEQSGFKVIEVIKTEGILRNSLFTLNSLGFLVRFIKGPISTLVTWIDNLTVPLFGESDLVVVAIKK